HARTPRLVRRESLLILLGPGVGIHSVADRCQGEDDTEQREKHLRGREGSEIRGITSDRHGHDSPEHPEHAADDRRSYSHTGSGHLPNSVLPLDKVLLALNLPLPVYLGRLVLAPDLCELVGQMIAELLLRTGRRRAEERTLRLGEFLFAERTPAPEFLQL